MTTDLERHDPNPSQRRPRTNRNLERCNTGMHEAVCTLLSEGCCQLEDEGAINAVMGAIQDFYNQEKKTDGGTSAGRTKHKNNT